MIDRRRLVEDLLSIATRTWDAAYDGEAREIAGFTAARIQAALGTARLNCEVRFERIPLVAPWTTNPRRAHAVKHGGYPQLRDLLSSGERDSVPLVAASSEESGPVLWDGHRRLETYRAAGRIDVPTWHARFRPGSGLVTIPQAT